MRLNIEYLLNKYEVPGLIPSTEEEKAKYSKQAHTSNPSTQEAEPGEF
jgi:hypothetical protein